MALWDAFIYNVLSMGIMFPWVYLWSSASFPGANLSLALVLTFAAQVPISITYCFLATDLPWTAGDYIYQTFAFGKWGSLSVLTGFVVCILQWIALSGWLFAKLGIAPLLMCMGVRYDTPAITRAGMAMQSPYGVLGTSIFITFAAVCLLLRPFRSFVVIQRVLFLFALAGITAMVATFLVPLSSQLVGNINDFVKILTQHLFSDVSPALKADFVGFIEKDVRASGGFERISFNLFSTLGAVPIMWTGFQWATYSVEQNDEICGAYKLRSQFIMLLGSAAFVALLSIIACQSQDSAIDPLFFPACSQAYWNQVGSPKTVTFLRNVFQPFPSLIAMAATRNPVVMLIIAVGMMANAFQITCNCLIGVGRIMMRMSEDAVLPRVFSPEKNGVSSQALHKAYMWYGFLSLPVIVASCLMERWSEYTASVTFGCSFVFFMSCLAATRLYSRRRPLLANHADGRLTRRGFGVIAVAYLATGSSGLMVVSYILIPQIGLSIGLSYAFLITMALLGYGFCRRWQDSQARVWEPSINRTDDVLEPGLNDVLGSVLAPSAGSGSGPSTPEAV
jgi:hypothetical protein